MGPIAWIKKFLKINPTLTVSDLDKFESHVQSVREEFYRLRDHVDALNVESRYVRKLLENEKLAERTEEEEREIDKEFTERRKNSNWDGPHRLTVDGKKVVRDELGREFIEETGETVDGYLDKLDQERREALAEVKQKRRAARRKAADLKAIVTQLPERIEPEELEAVS